MSSADAEPRVVDGERAVERRLHNPVHRQVFPLIEVASQRQFHAAQKRVAALQLQFGFVAELAPSMEQWQDEMRKVFIALERVLTPGGCVAFEVGEVKGGRVRLEEVVLRAVASTRLEPLLILINDPKFTKTAHCWGVQNNTKGTNTNRIVLMRKQ